MPEIGTSGSMSGEGKRSVGHRPQATAPFLDFTAGRASGYYCGIPVAPAARSARRLVA